VPGSDISYSATIWTPPRPFKLQGAEAGGARLFWTFYFVATGLHAAHMTAGIGLVARVAGQAGTGPTPPPGTARSR
jgi:heme/copper-type cytochrome/quinol oxidase subunit 3